MQRSLLSLLVIGHAGLAFGQPPPGYYDPALGLSGQPLKTALYGIIDNHVAYQYTQLWSFFPSTDDRPDGKVWDIYSDNPSGAEPYLFTFGTDQCGQYSDEGDCYNREHSFPQSWFNSTVPTVSDLFHIYPTDGVVNGHRGDLPYGRVGSVDWVSLNGTKVGPSNWPGYSNTVCEPIDEYKGDLARGYFYLMTRYMPQVPSWSCDMIAAGDLNIWATNLLMQWHAQDPVSQKEVDRNNAIYAVQQNRNPYIDHPEWVAYVWGPTAGIEGVEASTLRLWVADDVLHLEGAVPDGSLVEVLDALGRSTWSGRFTSSTVALPTLTNGTYIVRVGQRVLRFVR
ncbi:MAG: endonuclease [Flavobacteriales bacterium]|nr:endonuclease [Flavobacteriales bacterium]MBK9289412.1 endonuclease [Flavobacteriales bacterium]MBL0035856.1 endonuclease [Flavobacteriales bacterium]